MKIQLVPGTEKSIYGAFYSSRATKVDSRLKFQHLLLQVRTVSLIRCSV